MQRYSGKKALLVFRKLFLQTYRIQFLGQNIADIRYSLLIFSVLTAFTSSISLFFVDSLVRTKAASFWIAFFRISSLFFCFIVYLFTRKRFRFFERRIQTISVGVIFTLILFYIPMMVFDRPNHSYYLFGASIVIASASIILWIEPVRIFFITTVFLLTFLPLHFNYSLFGGFDRYIFYQDILIVCILLGFGIVANLLINYWRVEEHRTKTKLRVTVGKLLISNKKMEDLSRIDPLTGLHNRRHLLEQFELFKRRGARNGESIGLVILDLDRLKGINDKYGHKQGDLAIQSFAQTLRSRTRSTDIAARIGGDEFCLLVSPIDREGMETLTESIRSRIELLRIPHAPGVPEADSLRLTVSIGATLFSTPDDPSFDELYHRIDEALYQSKHEGRNRVTLLET